MDSQAAVVMEVEEEAAVVDVEEVEVVVGVENLNRHRRCMGGSSGMQWTCSRDAAPWSMHEELRMTLSSACLLA